MKKFVIISIILLLIGGGVLGYSVYRYIDVTRPEEPVATADEAVVETAEATEAPAETTEAEPASGDDIFSAGAEQAKTAVESMSKEEKVGQLILGICSDTTTASTEMNRYSLAGMLFQNANFDYMTPDDVKTLLATYKEEVNKAPILAAKEEGGFVTTVTGHDAFYEYVFDSPRNIYDTDGLNGVERMETEKANLLSQMGINLNLAPVVDLAAEMDQIMYSRSLCGDADITAQYAAYVTRTSQAKGVSVALKHYPGYGTIPDSYDPVVTDTRESATIKDVDSVPFKAGIEAGAHFVMMSNVVVENIDPLHTASLSPELHRMLREDLGFGGLIITDTLDDGADFSAYTDGKATVVAAILAGNDMVIVNDYATAYTDLLSAVNDGTIASDELDAICTRVLAYKYTAGILK